MTITDYLMNIGLIALVVLQIRGHKVTRARLLFPLVATVFVAAQFLHAIPTAGNDLVLIVGLTCVGAALGAAENPIPPAQATSRYSWMSPPRTSVRPRLQGRDR